VFTYCIYLLLSSGFLHCVVCFVCSDVSETRTGSFRVTDLLKVDGDANWSKRISQTLPINPKYFLHPSLFRIHLNEISRPEDGGSTFPSTSEKQGT